MVCVVRYCLHTPEESLTFWRDQGPFRYVVVLR